MSRGTTFRLLKKSNVCVSQIYLETVEQKFLESERNDGIFNKMDSENPFPQFIKSNCKEFDLICRSPLGAWNVALEMTFNSIFNEVRQYFEDEFNMNAYSASKSQMVITKNIAKDMLAAVDYILLEHFDSGIERVMNNDFIVPIGSLSEQYSNFKYRKILPDDNEYNEGDTYYGILERLKCILTAFLYADDDDEYTLLVELWG